jgi:predicted DNA-binding transcriptional regulator AlpA
MSDKLLISVNDFCCLLSISRAHYFERRAAGGIGPAEIKLGRKILLRRAEVEQWVSEGCPPRRSWSWRKGGAK